MSRISLLGLFLLAACPSRSDVRFCNATTPCRDPAFPYCDEVTSECEAGPVGADLATAVDGGEPDFSVGDDLATTDLSPDLAADLATPPDLTTPLDLTLPPDLLQPCSGSASCLSPATPICDSTNLCRACTGSGDDTACVTHGLGLVCKTSGLNQGRCTDCNTNSDCAAATPICNPDGSCRKCSGASDCATGVCDLRAGGTNGQCAGAGDIVYVDVGAAGCGTGDGSAAKPYCQISDGVINLGGKHFVKVAGSTTSYDGFVKTSMTNRVAYISGPGRDAATPATITAPTGGMADNAISFVPGNNAVDNLTFDGFIFQGTDGSVVYCDGNQGNVMTSATLTVRNSLIKGGLNGARAIRCNLTVTETIIQGPSALGATFEGSATWTLQNDIISGAGTAGVSIGNASTAGGVFRFNTVAFNGSGANFGGVLCGVATTLESSIITQNAQSPAGTGSQFGPAASTNCSLSKVVTGTDSIGNTGKLSGDPVFRSTTAPYDLRLKVNTNPDITTNTACCIDQVGASGTTPILDVERDPRPKGASFDVGADEAL